MTEDYAISNSITFQGQPHEYFNGQNLTDCYNMLDRYNYCDKCIANPQLGHCKLPAVYTYTQEPVSDVQFIFVQSSA